MCGYNACIQMHQKNDIKHPLQKGKGEESLLITGMGGGCGGAVQDVLATIIINNSSCRANTLCRLEPGKAFNRLAHQNVHHNPHTHEISVFRMLLRFRLQVLPTAIQAGEIGWWFMLLLWVIAVTFWHIITARERGRRKKKQRRGHGGFLWLLLLFYATLSGQVTGSSPMIQSANQLLSNCSVPVVTFTTSATVVASANRC